MQAKATQPFYTNHLDLFHEGSHKKYSEDHPQSHNKFRGTRLQQQIQPYTNHPELQTTNVLPKICKKYSEDNTMPLEVPEAQDFDSERLWRRPSQLA